ncbi:uncharacterized protein LOC121835767, partial [Ixodes scapularis]|uniref:uncharacterized protein LOC121835767 n=1 Tax=Ixodes scapularis TaxID=6945 RepID=UPI001C386F66
MFLFQKQVLRMCEELRATMAHNLDYSQWMTANTRQHAISKAKGIKFVVAEQNPDLIENVCELHFADSDILRVTSHTDAATGCTVKVPLQYPRLCQGAVPHKFRNCPNYLSTTDVNVREDPEARRVRLEADALQTAVAESMDLFQAEEEADRILGIKDVTDYLRSKKSGLWHVIESNNCLILVHIVHDEAPWIKYLIVLNADLRLTFHVGKMATKRLESSLQIPASVNSKKALIKLLESIELWDNSLSTRDADEDIFETIHLLLGQLSTTPAEDKVHAIQFLNEQLALLSKKKEQRRYSVDFMIFCCIFFTISPHAYKYVRSSGNIFLPHPATIRSICSSYDMNPQHEHRSSTFLSYMRKRIFDLDDRQRFVTLMVDEVHIKPFFDYKGGNITGVALNSTEPANSAFVFMLQSITSNFKEVAHIVPVHRADAKFLHKMLGDVICELENIGYRVVCVVSDNNAVNRKAMSHFVTPPPKEPRIVYPHPSDPPRPLFFVIDPVHILKCIRNNWLNQQDDKVCFYYPEFESEPTRQRRRLRASFETIRDAHNLECEQVLRFGYTPSRKALNPSSIERQNVKLALQIFHESLPHALRALGSKTSLQYCEETASFIEIIVKWWNIMNVKTPCKGMAKRDDFQKPLFPSMDDPKVDFLYNLLDWLEEWKSTDFTGGKLTPETHAALHQTTYALLEVARYCFEELQLSYFLLGKIQTDSLEERFGKYRRLAGSQYHVSIRQIFEAEHKLRLQSTLPKIATASVSGSKRDEQWEDLFKRTDAPRPNCNVVVTEEALSQIKDIIPVLVYVAGYAVYATVKKLNCEKCRAVWSIDKTITVSVMQQHYDLVRELDRGGLIHPTMFVVNAVANNYVVVVQLSKQPEFLQMPNQRQVATELTVELLASDEFSDFDTCGDGHTSEQVLKHILWCSTNIML